MTGRASRDRPTSRSTREQASITALFAYVSPHIAWSVRVSHIHFPFYSSSADPVHLSFRARRGLPCLATTCVAISEFPFSAPGSVTSHPSPALTRKPWHTTTSILRPDLNISTSHRFTLTTRGGESGQRRKEPQVGGSNASGLPSLSRRPTEPSRTRVADKQQSIVGRPHQRRLMIPFPPRPCAR